MCMWFGVFFRQKVRGGRGKEKKKREHKLELRQDPKLHPLKPAAAAGMVSEYTG